MHVITVEDKESKLSLPSLKNDVKVLSPYKEQISSKTEMCGYFGMLPSKNTWLTVMTEREARLLMDVLTYLFVHSYVTVSL